PVSAARGAMPREGADRQGEDPGDSSDLHAAADLEVPALRTSTTPEKPPELTALNAGLPPAPGPSPGSSTQAVVQAAASALRDAAPTNASPAPVAAHATLREPVGTARWADELGNRLVLMSVRGQQQGSLTLTPEHLGPVEVQISVHRDTANVWFGAQHADTRAALTEAMPRLRELLASSGLSLGQSGVSEQAPRQGFASPDSRAGGDVAALDAGPVEAPAPVWRAWRPGLIDTYA
ncbi:MAG TPA: flagellar hook-length control protein FliK, partial [Steroidobacteraceae bacterium]|nr:flagellar hook-length control protein FliK [Steroidobacteraceae bacterium]